MAITTLDGLIAGLKAPFDFYKLSGTTVAGRFYSPYLNAGIPGAATAPANGIQGNPLTTLAGQIPFTNPAGGSNSYLGKFNGLLGNIGRILLVDRLWHNSGLSATSTSTQPVGQAVSSVSVANPTVVTTANALGAVNGDVIYIKVPWSTPAIDGYYTVSGVSGSTFTIPVNVTVAGTPGAGSIAALALPARDSGGNKDGVGVILGVEVMSTLGAGTPTWTVFYTNSAGTVGQSVVTAAITSAMVVGSFIPIQLAAGDKGIRAIESFKLSATMSSGTYSLVMYRVLASLDVTIANSGMMLDAISCGMPQLFDNTVPMLLVMPNTTSSGVIVGSMAVAQG